MAGCGLRNVLPQTRTQQINFTAGRTDNPPRNTRFGFNRISTGKNASFAGLMKRTAARYGLGNPRSTQTQKRAHIRSLKFIRISLSLHIVDRKRPAHDGPFQLVDFGADERTRTADLLITNQLLYQLSYAGPASGERSPARLRIEHTDGTGVKEETCPPKKCPPPSGHSLHLLSAI